MTADLIKALEEAEEGSRDLSDRVLLALGWLQTRDPCLVCEDHDVCLWLRPDGVYLDKGPSPTESVDDGLALVPDGWRWGVCSVDKKYDAWLSRWSSEWIECEGATPTLALCAVIIKAKGHK